MVKKVVGKKMEGEAGRKKKEFDFMEFKKDRRRERWWMIKLGVETLLGLRHLQL